MILALSQEGYDVIGLEIDPGLADLAKIAVDGRDRVQVRVQDVLRADLNELGKFDVICCNAVIEHVMNPEKLIATIAELLNEGGVLHLEVPNKDCITSVISDLHYQSFGLQLLPYGSAVSFHGRIRKDEQYTVGDFFEKSWYESRLRRLGIPTQVEVADWGSRFTSVEADLGRLWAAFQEWCSIPPDDIDYLIHAEVRRRFLKYFSQASSALADAHTGDPDAFEMRYGAMAWTFIGTKG